MPHMCGTRPSHRRRGTVAVDGEQRGDEQMNQQDDNSYRPLPEGRSRAVARRDAGRDRVRRISAWTAATLVAGMAAGAGYFAHTTATTPGAATQQTPASAHVSGQRPSLSHPVATSGGSGVTAGSTAGSGRPASAVSWRDN